MRFVFQGGKFFVRDWLRLLVPRFRKSSDSPRVPPPLGVVAVAAPLILFSVTSFLCCYFLLSSEWWFKRVWEKAEAQARTTEERERARIVREATRLGVQNPMVRMFLSLEQALVSLRTLASVAFGGWLMLGLLTARWSGTFTFWRWISLGSGVLALGNVVHLFLKLLLGSEVAGLNAAVLFDRPRASDPADFFLFRANLFVLWFIWTVSSGVSGTYQESGSTIFAVLFLVWAAVMLLSFLFQFEAYLLL